MINRLRVLMMLLAACCVALPAAAYTTAREAFVNAPQGVMMLLTKNDRLDMLDYYESGQTVSVTNGLEGKSRITAMSPEMMTIAMTPSSTYTLMMLPSGVMGLIITIESPAKDSHLTFYNAADWSELPSAKYFTAPGLADWLTPKGKADRALVESMVPFIMADYAYDPATGVLQVSNDLATFLSADVYEMIADDLYPQLSYKWNGKKFEKTR